MTGVLISSDPLHFLFVLAVTGLMLIAEVFTTAIEALCDYVEPRQDERIKIIKDMAAGATMLAIVIWYVGLIVVLVELFARARVTAVAR